MKITTTLRGREVTGTVERTAGDHSVTIESVRALPGADGDVSERRLMWALVDAYEAQREPQGEPSYRCPITRDAESFQRETLERFDRKEVGF